VQYGCGTEIVLDLAKGDADEAVSPFVILIDVLAAHVFPVKLSAIFISIHAVSTSWIGAE
jgi:hypothetical protein